MSSFVKNKVRHVAILIAASPTAAFYSQLAVPRLAMRKLECSRWQATIHVNLGGADDPEALDVASKSEGSRNKICMSETVRREGDWFSPDDKRVKSNDNSRIGRRGDSAMIGRSSVIQRSMETIRKKK
jgi:hypothetical protein